MNFNFKIIVLMALSLCATADAQTGLIDFERLPDGSTPTEGMAISNQFFNSYGVSFAYTNGTFPLIAKRGGTNTFAFTGPSGDNEPAANQGIGNYFLTDSSTNSIPPPLIITYRQAVSNASGVVIDIDGMVGVGNEAWLFEARGIDDSLLATNRLTVSSPNAGDGLATPWSFTNVPGIWSIHVIYNGKKPTAGFAFDNFSPGFSIAPPSLAVTVTQRVAQIEVTGSFNGNYLVEWATSISSASWQTLTNLHLTNAPQQSFNDYAPSNTTMRFYRATGF